MEIKVAVLGGSNPSLPNPFRDKDVIDKKTIKTPFGESGIIYIIKVGDSLPIAFLSRHGEGGYRITAPYVNYRANIWALKEIGVERILSWSGPGAINKDLHPGNLVIPDDLIDMTKTRTNTFFENTGLGFVRQNPVFCPASAEILKKKFKNQDVSYKTGGVYICTEGPRLETPAEIRYFGKIGADMVGMTLVPEVFLAKELEMCYTPACYITNYAEGVKNLGYEKGTLFEGTLPEAMREDVDISLKTLRQVIMDAALKLTTVPRKCSCQYSMLRYKKKGMIGENFRDWIGKRD